VAGGRPSKYKPEYCKQAKKLAFLGATDKELADFFEVEEKTINNWKKEHPEFLQSLNEAKAEADAIVVKSLFKRAIGYSHPAVKIFQRNTFRKKLAPLNEDMPEEEDAIEDTDEMSDALVVPYTEYYPPDTTACIFWLKNRDRENWRDKIDQEVTGKDGGPIQYEQVVDKPPVETPEQWQERVQRQLEAKGRNLPH